MARDKQELQGGGKEEEEEGGSRVISITFPPSQSGQRELTRSLQGIRLRLEFHIIKPGSGLESRASLEECVDKSVPRSWLWSGIT